MTKVGRKQSISYNRQRKIILYFINNKNNSTSVIAERYNIDKKSVNRILDRYFKKIQNKL